MTHAATLTLRPDAEGIACAAALLAGGQVVALPTETVYGLAADARNALAVARVYEAKGRPAFNPLIVHLPDAAAAAGIGVIEGEAARLAAALAVGAGIPADIAALGITEDAISPGRDCVLAKDDVHVGSAEAIYGAE